MKNSSKGNFDINKYSLENYVKRIKKRKEEPEKREYTIYKSNEFAKFANKIVEPITMFLLRKFPDFFKPLEGYLKLVSFNMLSKSYFSIMILASISSFFIASILFSVILLNPISGITIGFLVFIATILVFYFYPKSVIGSTNRKIRSELPFAIVHMAGIAGSGTVPVNIFKLLIQSKEYPELNKEFKKILNYVNVFGYNLSTALKSVADKTPSKDFAELLNGIVSTIETGGDLTDYLEKKANDSLSTYKLDRQKYVESLSAYSDIYTGILVAAPLFFVITLTIINAIGGTIGGFTVTQIANFGTFLLIPLLNIGFIAFLTLTQPEV